MKYELTCPHCKHVMRTPFVRVGATAACRSCHGKFPVKADLVKQVPDDTRMGTNGGKTSPGFNPLSAGDAPAPNNAAPIPPPPPPMRPPSFTPPAPTNSSHAALASSSSFNFANDAAANDAVPGLSAPAAAVQTPPPASAPPAAEPDPDKQPAFTLDQPATGRHRKPRKKRSVTSLIFIMLFSSVILATLILMIILLYRNWQEPPPSVAQSATPTGAASQKRPAAPAPNTAAPTAPKAAAPAPAQREESIFETPTPHEVPDEKPQAGEAAPAPTRKPDAARAPAPRPAPAANRKPVPAPPGDTGKIAKAAAEAQGVIANGHPVKTTVLDALPATINPAYPARSQAGKWTEGSEAANLNNTGLVTLEDVLFLPRADSQPPAGEEGAGKDARPVPGAFTANALSAGLNAVETATLRLELLDENRRPFARYEQPLNLVVRSEKRPIRVDIPEKFRDRAVSHKWRVGTRSSDIVSAYTVITDPVLEVVLLPKQTALKLQVTNNAPSDVTKCLVLVEAVDGEGQIINWTASVPTKLATGETRDLYVALPVAGPAGQSLQWSATVLTVVAQP